MRTSLVLSLALHAAALGTAWYLLGSPGPVPSAAPALFVRPAEALAAPEIVAAPPLRLVRPAEPIDWVEPIEPQAAEIELEPLQESDAGPRQHPPLSSLRVASAWTRRVRAPRPRPSVAPVRTLPAPALPAARKPQPRAQPRAGRVISAKPLAGRTQPVSYPARAQRLGLQGTVILRLLVDLSGTVSKVEVWRPSGHPILDRAAAAGVRSWRFRPARRDGRAIQQWLRIPIRFRIRSRD